MTDIEKLREDILKSGATAYDISMKTGLTQSAIGRFLKGTVENPHKSSIDLLKQYLRDIKGERKPTAAAPQKGMLKEKIDLTKIPYFDIDASAGDGLIGNYETSSPDAYISVPGFAGCDLAINVRGDSMLGRYNPGDIIGIKKITDYETISWGSCHVVTTDEQAFIKFLRYDEENPEFIILKSQNDHYQDMRFHKSKIKSLWLVKGKIERSEL